MKFEITGPVLYLNKAELFGAVKCVVLSLAVEDFGRNPVLFWNFDTTKPIGRVRSLSFENGLMSAEADVFDENFIHPKMYFAAGYIAEQQVQLHDTLFTTKANLVMISLCLGNTDSDIGPVNCSWVECS